MFIKQRKKRRTSDEMFPDAIVGRTDPFSSSAQSPSFPILERCFSVGIILPAVDVEILCCKIYRRRQFSSFLLSRRFRYLPGENPNAVFAYPYLGHTSMFLHKYQPFFDADNSIHDRWSRPGGAFPCTAGLQYEFQYPFRFDNLVLGRSINDSTFCSVLWIPCRRYDAYCEVRI